MTLWATMDTDPFFSIWYWILSACFWSYICTRTFGASRQHYDRAQTDPDEAALYERIVRANLNRTVRAAERFPVAVRVAQSFLISALITFAVVMEDRLAQGLAFLIVPAVLFDIVSTEWAKRLHKRTPERAALMRSVVNFRRVKVVVAAACLLAAVGFGMATSLEELQFRSKF